MTKWWKLGDILNSRTIVRKLFEIPVLIKVQFLTESGSQSPLYFLPDTQV